MENRFYTYGHFRPDTGKIFYVGKGTGKRIYDKNHRNKHWHNTVNKYGINHQVLMENLTEDESIELEEFLIEEIGLDNLTNVEAGGQPLGSYDKTGENNPMWGKIHPNKGKKMPQNGHQKRLGMVHSEESKKKNQLSQKTRISCDINGRIFNSIKEASKKLGIPISTISNRLKNVNFPNYKFNFKQ